jgi:hypothetical protein
MEEQTLAIPIDKIKADLYDILKPERNRRKNFSGSFEIKRIYFLKKDFAYITLLISKS